MYIYSLTWKIFVVTFTRTACAKGKVYKTVVRPAMMYGLETVPLTKKQEAELAVAELKMLRFSLGVTRMPENKHEFIRGTAHVRQIGDKVREARLRWYGHMQSRDGMQSILVKGVVLGAARYGEKRKKEKRKTKDEVHGCGKREHASGWSVRSAVATPNGSSRKKNRKEVAFTRTPKSAVYVPKSQC